MMPAQARLGERTQVGKPPYARPAASKENGVRLGVARATAKVLGLEGTRTGKVRLGVFTGKDVNARTIIKTGQKSSKSTTSWATTKTEQATKAMAIKTELPTTTKSEPPTTNKTKPFPKSVPASEQPGTNSSKPNQSRVNLKRRPLVSAAPNLPKTRRVEGPNPKARRSLFPIQKSRPKSTFDVSDLRLALDGCGSPPEGVINVDAGAGLMWSPEYAADIVAYLKAWENNHKLSQRLLEGPSLSSNVHAVLVDWLLQVQIHLHLQQETLHLCVALVHRFFLKEPELEVTQVQLAGVTCLLIAAKFFERFAPQIDQLIHLTDNTYTFTQVERMERLVLRRLRFQIHLPLATDFTERFCKVADLHDKRLVGLVSYLLDLTLPDLASATFPASQRTAAAVTLARGVLIQDRENADDLGFQRALTFYSGWAPCDLRPVMKRMTHLLMRADTARCQAAREKYKKSSWHKVSALPGLRDTTVLASASGLTIANRPTPVKTTT